MDKIQVVKVVKGLKEQIDKLKIANEFIQENKNKIKNQYRLKYHLMGEYGWINDPNGFIFYEEKYHLFYQHHPYSGECGPMHWGHAISTDLIKWEYLPITMAPDAEFDKDGCFSGTSIVKDGKLSILYTGHICIEKNKENYKQVQNYAYSEDGIHFEKYSGNPVIDINEIPKEASRKDIRDPKVFKIGDLYYIILGSIGILEDKNDLEKYRNLENRNSLELVDKFSKNNIESVDYLENISSVSNGQVLLYKSSDLVKWEYVSVFAKGNSSMGKVWECPDFFQLEEKDVLIVSPQYMKKEGLNYHNLHSTIYMLGNFNIEKGEFIFKDYYPVDYGFDFYAPQSIEDEKGRRILIGWMEMWESEMPTIKESHNWAGAMTLPRELFINNNQLYFKPVEEIKNYRKNEFKVEDLIVEDELELNCLGDSYEIMVTFEALEAEEFGIKLRANDKEETLLSYNTENKIFTLNRDRAGKGPKGERNTELYLKKNKLTLNIFVDISSVEVFLNDGEKTMTARIYPNKESNKIKIFSRGECKVESLYKWDIE